MSQLFEVRILRADCVREDVYHFTSEKTALRARRYAEDHLGAQEASIQPFNPAPKATTFQAFKKDILMLEGRDEDPEGEESSNG